MTATNRSLSVTQFVKAAPEKVFAAWIRPELVEQWLCPEECVIVANSADVRVGGSYRSSMKCNGEVHTVAGTYREIVPNEKIVFTHRWEQPGSIDTVVTVLFAPKAGGTEVILTQTGFDDAAEAKGHEQGWSSALRNLLRLFP